MKSPRMTVPHFSMNWQELRMKMVSSPTVPSWTNCAARHNFFQPILLLRRLIFRFHGKFEIVIKQWGNRPEKRGMERGGAEPTGNKRVPWDSGQAQLLEPG